MRYIDGPLEVTKPDTDFVFTMEIGQGAHEFVFASGDLEEAVQQLSQKDGLPDAFLEALKGLKELGEKVDWQWDKIAVNSAE